MLTRESLGGILSGSGVSALAFKGYKFSNVGTLKELEHGMRAVGLPQKLIERDAPTIMRVLRSKGGRVGLVLSLITGGGYALYEMASPAAPAPAEK